LVGEEKQIRFFFFNFFWFIFEEKTDIEKELANQYLGLIEILQEIPRITLDHTEILQIKLWMKFSFRRMVLEPLPTLSP
ncbi:helix-turn-helix domain-containing protein, partial [Enterococcus faecalis]